MTKQEKADLLKMSKKDRLAYLEKHAYRIREGYSYQDNLTDQEKVERADQIVSATLAHEKAENELKEMIAPIKARLKHLRQDITAASQSLESGTIFRETTAYLFPNRGTKKMDYVDPDGNVVFTRDLLPEESQKAVSEMQEVDEPFLMDDVEEPVPVEDQPF